MPNVGIVDDMPLIIPMHEVESDCGGVDDRCHYCDNGDCRIDTPPTSSTGRIVVAHPCRRIYKAFGLPGLISSRTASHTSRPSLGSSHFRYAIARSRQSIEGLH